MAWTKDKAVERVIQHLQKNSIPLQDSDARAFSRRGYARIGGFNCKVANVVGNNSFRVRVCKEWFEGGNLSKPRIKTSVVEFEYQLFPTRKYLFAVYYLALRDYALQLEKERSTWFKKPNWGMRINENTGMFSWKGENILSFPLLVLSTTIDLELREKQYHTRSSFQDCDLNLAFNSDG